MKNKLFTFIYCILRHLKTPGKCLEKVPFFHKNKADNNSIQNAFVMMILHIIILLISMALVGINF